MSTQSSSVLQLRATRLAALAESAQLRLRASELLDQADAIDAAVNAPADQDQPAVAPAVAPATPGPAPSGPREVLTMNADGSATWA